MSSTPQVPADFRSRQSGGSPSSGRSRSPFSSGSESAQEVEEEQVIDVQDSDSSAVPGRRARPDRHLAETIAREVQAALRKYKGKGGASMDEVCEQVQMQEQ